MTYNQKFIYQHLLKGAFITITPTGGRPYTLYNNKMQPLKRMTERSFGGLKKLYGHAELLKKEKSQYTINKEAIIQLRNNTWLKKQL